jgi:hypothetical protein
MIRPRDKKELKEIILDTIKSDGLKADLNFIDTSGITDMSHLFSYSKFNGDISRWNTGNVLDMEGMFRCSNFNGIMLTLILEHN